MPSESQKPKLFYDMLIGSSESMRAVYEFIDKAAKTDVPVLITGETGTGKELVARAIHLNSQRRYKHFIVINCPAIPENLAESELFGHEKGSFTGAYEAKVGKFELAEGGVIFLDEIGILGPNIQAKLLRVLQEGTIERIGGTRNISVNVRILAATNADLEEAIRRGTFRADLYYRLKVASIVLPPLRDHKEDIPDLVKYFIWKYSKGSEDQINISPQALEIMMNYRWPGNVRELENLIRGLYVTATETTIHSHNLPPEIRLCDLQSSGSPLKDALADFEREYIIHALERFDWNVTKTSRSLNIHRNTLITKMHRLNITK